MKRTEAVIIGGGQAGLAMSRCLGERGVAHVVLERGRIGERWRSERWDSARLLTPNWQSRLPEWYYRGSDPDGYMSMQEFVEYLEAYARSFDAPVQDGTTVQAVDRLADGGYRVTTDRGVWAARNVVVATGHCDVPYVPAAAKDLAGDVEQLVPTKYRNPAGLLPGGVLVVGASASGSQLAAELRAAGRDVTLAVGRHIRLPRRYRGMDILWWLEMSGRFREEVEPGRQDRFYRSMQLAGRSDARRVDLGALQDAGVRLTGRVVGTDGHRVTLADDLDATTAEADERLSRLLDRIDAFVTETGMDERVGPPERLAPVRPAPAPREIDLATEGIGTVIWATGFRRSYPWLRVPVLDERGEIRHRGGITPLPGLYVIGLQSLRRRNSNMIDGVGMDAEELSRHLAARRRRSEGSAA
jgi:putative flavoprotein involved in K+ transport